MFFSFVSSVWVCFCFCQEGINVCSWWYKCFIINLTHQWLSEQNAVFPDTMFFIRDFQGSPGQTSLQPGCSTVGLILFKVKSFVHKPLLKNSFSSGCLPEKPLKTSPHVSLQCQPAVCMKVSASCNLVHRAIKAELWGWGAHSEDLEAVRLIFFSVVWISPSSLLMRLWWELQDSETWAETRALLFSHGSSASFFLQYVIFWTSGIHPQQLLQFKATFLQTHS